MPVKEIATIPHFPGQTLQEREGEDSLPAASGLSLYRLTDFLEDHITQYKTDYLRPGDSTFFAPSDAPIAGLVGTLPADLIAQRMGEDWRKYTMRDWELGIEICLKKMGFRGDLKWGENYRLGINFDRNNGVTVFISQETLDKCVPVKRHRLW